MLRYFLLMILSSLALTTQAQQITFDLENAQGQVQLDQIENKYILLAFGYTSCPDICPTTLYEFASVLKQLDDADAILPIFVTIDPINDTAQKLDEYVQYFDPRILGLTGSIQNIKHLSDQLGATFGYRLDNKRVEMPQKDSGYTVYHSSLVYLLNPKHELIDVFDYQIGADDLAHALNQIINKQSKHTSTQTSDIKTISPIKSNNTIDQDCALPDGFQTSNKVAQLNDFIPTSEIDQKVSLLNIWALWCAPCRVELPVLNELAKQNHSNLNIYNLNLGASEQEVHDFFKKNELMYLTTHTHEDLAILKRLGGKGLPFNALFVNGKLLGIKHGIIQDTSSLTDFAQCIQHTH